MNLIVFIWIFILASLLILQFRPTTLREGLENNDCPNDEKARIYKNSGSIQNLQDAVNSVQKTVSTLQTTSDKHSASISTLNDTVSSIKDILQKDTKLSDENKQKLKRLGNEINDKVKAKQKQLNKLSSVNK